MGVVEDTVYTDVKWTDHLIVFVPTMQRPSNYGPIENDMNLYAGAIVLQTDRPMSEMETITRRTLAGINPNLTVVKFQTFDQQIADRFTEERMLSRLTMMFGGAGAVAGGDWAVRRDGIYSGPTNLGDRDTDGARCGPRGRGRNDYARCDGSGGARTRDRSSGGIAVCTFCEGAAV